MMLLVELRCAVFVVMIQRTGKINFKENNNKTFMNLA